MIEILRWFITSKWIHIPHLSMPGGREALLTGRLLPTKTESVSESVDKITGGSLRLQVFLCRPRFRKLSHESRARMLSGTASAFWRSRSSHLLGLERTPASTTSPKGQVLERELCIATSLPETRLSKRSIGQKWKRWP